MFLQVKRKFTISTKISGVHLYFYFHTFSVDLNEEFEALQLLPEY